MEQELKCHAYWDKTSEFIIALIESGYATMDQLHEAMAERQRRRPAIGELAVRRRLLTVNQVFRILGEQATTEEMFGAIAVRMEFLKHSDLESLLTLQAKLTPSLFEVLIGQAVLTCQQADELEQQVRKRLQSVCSPQLEQVA